LNWPFRRVLLLTQIISLGIILAAAALYCCCFLFFACAPQTSVYSHCSTSTVAARLRDNPQLTAAMLTTAYILALAACWSNVAAHLVITYPGWRGNNLKNSGNVPEGSLNIPDNGLGVSYSNTSQELVYPYGMQWIYPCKKPKPPCRSVKLTARQAVAWQPPRTEPNGPSTAAP
jgi:hypothetical protein